MLALPGPTKLKSGLGSNHVSHNSFYQFEFCVSNPFELPLGFRVNLNAIKPPNST